MRFINRASRHYYMNGKDLMLREVSETRNQSDILLATAEHDKKTEWNQVDRLIELCVIANHGQTLLAEAVNVIESHGVRL